MSDQNVRLPDGRTLGYAEFGDHEGVPLLYFHGFPSSRLEISELHDRAVNHQVRILALDRPGFGLSTHDPDRKITDWPSDVKSFTAHLNLTRYMVLGYSGGGPYALACAKELPSSELIAVGVVACAPLWTNGYRSKGVSWTMRQLYLAVNYAPSVTRATLGAVVGTLRLLGGNRRPTRNSEQVGMALNGNEPRLGTSQDKSQSSEDHVSLGSSSKCSNKRGETFLAKPLESFAQGTAGFMQEANLLCQDWGMVFTEITHDRVYMWHGIQDKNAPIETARAVAAQIPHCVWEESDDTHSSIGRHFDKFLKTVLQHLE